ncbi:MAG: hypothetical protein ABSH44_22355 [Bryobacteraceae bacterium]|jgi:hypothetical protein
METETETATDSPVVETKPAAPPVIVGAVIIALAILVAGWMVTRSHVVQFDKPYQAVLLSNGQVYYGRLEGYGTEHPVLREVYYIQSSVNPQTHEQTNILLRRGKEWHAPDRMYLNPSQILLVEPVGTDSKVADLIKDLRAQQ